MDDIGDYIYLIIIAIAGLSSLFKKKKEKPTPISVEEEPSTGLEDVWEDFLPDNPVARVPEPKESFFEWENKEKKIATYENTADPSALRAKNKVEKYKSSMKTTPRRIVVDEQVSNSFDIELNTVEDARTAFIYAEIFNKRY